ncbi:hypothetical protein Pan216_21150 [Planctomycetes bacterium Pan216]|uniref:Uncharacterized protein n=1 Tax=Kolteria novifilia TaxID=2527975 RepID=A0A518B2P3_9BACT|nr:hypothetical protein Pan216_21150 [Planctomycetes bacterium Pan216]
MSTPIDCLREGQWIAITDERDETSSCWNDSYIFHSPRPKKKNITGEPLRIEAISLPFLLVNDGQHLFAIDVRRVEVTLLRHRYAKILRPSTEKDVVQMPIKQAQSKLCPLCQEKMIERMRGIGEWMLACKQCGFEGKVAKK